MQKRRLAIAAAVLVGAVSLAGCGSHKKDAGGTGSPSPADNKPTAAPVSWPAPSDATAQAKAAGLPMLGQEGQVLHIHSHLDVFVDGKPVTVPAEIGIDLARQQISPLHTHDTS